MTDEERAAEQQEQEHYYAHQALQYVLQTFGVPETLRLISEEMIRPADLDDNIPF